ncbi:hypothetical protein JOH50_004873 [Rhizobium leguminosarum]|uniref:hypothetical protein n=1 Tax=Rhizobium leguminosarum TaxID=384 RepID=UPI001AE76797|nr:hypothetical protein [Rhizobium leguminosarum]MBP2489146.1 hypothetical protein [Rhizobium leguminosarum]
MRKIALSACLIMASISAPPQAYSQEAAPPGELGAMAQQCGALTNNVKTASDKAKSSVDEAKIRADSETQDEKGDVDACAAGYITMEQNHIALDIPEITMKDQEIILDLPQVTMKQQKIVFGTPSVKCEDVKTGQYPEFTCEDTWIIVDLPFGQLKTKGAPSCTTKWTDIITTQCFPFFEQQEIVMGIPEFKIDQTSFVIGIPEVTMKRQDWYFDLPKFNVTEGCIGAECEKKCAAASEKYTNEYQSILQPAVEQAKMSVAKATNASMTCQKNVISLQKDKTLAEIDANIAIIRGTLTSLTAMGATEAAANVSKTLEDLIRTREKIEKQFQSQIDSLTAQSTPAVETSFVGEAN